MTNIDRKLEADEALMSLLHQGDVEDLALLCDYLTDNGRGRISLSSENCARLEKAKNQLNFSPLTRKLIFDEFKCYGGHTLANLFRGSEGTSYMTILRDVGKQFKVDFTDEDRFETLEMRILLKLSDAMMSKMSTEERTKFLGDMGLKGSQKFYSDAFKKAFLADSSLMFQVALMVANTIAMSVTGRHLAMIGIAARVLPFAGAGPIGWAISALWTGFSLASPAYRVTVPMVAQLAYMRQKQIHQRSLNAPTAS
jgi:uncharacterized protein YaaW (UPF0174 family)